MPERGSVERFAAGNTNCHPHSFAASGYFRANALCSSAWDVRSLHKLRAKQYWGKVGIGAAAASALPYAPSPCPSPTRGEGTYTRKTRKISEGERGPSRPEHLFRLLHQFRPKVGVGNTDQRLGALALSFTLQIDDAELSDDEVHVLPGCGQRAAWLQHRHDARELAPFCRRRQDHDRAPAFGVHRPHHERHLPADA